MMHNNLFLNRIIIYTKNGKIAYDEAFHHGVNIIYGDNSSGKSTITHFIFYVLGGAFNDWVKEAKRCSHVIAEVSMNEAVLTLKREINVSDRTQKANASEPMYIFWGDLQASSQSKNKEKWQKYSYSISDDKKSFSNVFFDILKLPIVKGDNNITFHQLLRLLYVDQESPTSSLFLYEKFDSILTRETVSDLLLGVYNQDLYDSKQKKVEIEKDLDETKREIKIIKKFNRKEDLIPSNIQTRIDNFEKKLHKLKDEIITLKEKKKTVRYTQKTKFEFEKLEEEAILQRKKILKLENNINSIKLEIDDTKYFIEILNSKIKAIQNSILTRELLGDFPLEYCPECLSPIKAAENQSSCKLCKEPKDKSSITQAMKIEQEISFQIKESELIVRKRERELIDLEAKYNSEREKLFYLQKEINSVLKDIKSIRDEKIDSLYTDKGLLEGEIMQLRKLLENAEIYQELIAKQYNLERALSSLKDTISYLEYEQEKTKKEVREKVEEKGVLLLNNDLERQEEFIRAKTFKIDYRNNIAYIKDKDAKYSASSNFYLKVAARYSLFLASLEVEKMRYPRFILCDNMEDKGMEDKRVHNFQKLLVKEVEQYKSDDFQIIYTTSKLPDELKDSPFHIGEYYTKENPSLKYVND